MKNERLLLVLSILLMLLSAAVGIAGNLATNSVPEEWKPHLWIAWLAFGIFLVITIFILIWQWVTQGGKPEPPEKPAYVHEGWFLKHIYRALPNFTGRKTEQARLTVWLKDANEKPLLVMLALGGFGKSALCWHWLHHDETAKQLPRVVWWNFYEDNNFETFLRETLEYLDLKPEALSPSQQVEILTRFVRENRILLVLDGFERILRIYHNLSAAYQGDEIKARKGSIEEKQNNQCISDQAANFLQRVSSAGARGRVLVASRLLPSDLFARQSGERYDCCDVYELEKMSKEDAVEFFHKQKINGARAEIETACETYGYHPLSLRLLAGQLAKTPGRDIRNAEKLKIDADLKGRQNHILKVAYDSLPRRRRKLFSQIACFRSSISAEQIAVFAGMAKTAPPNRRPAKPGANDRKNPLQRVSQVAAGGFIRWRGWAGQIALRVALVIIKPMNLNAALRDFSERGLLHHDETKDEYDMHPIVRRYAYERLTAPDKNAAHQRLADYFAAAPPPQKVEKLEDLAAVIELYHHMVSAGKLDEAKQIFKDRLDTPTYYQFGAYQLQIELLLSLFPDGEDKPPRLKTESAQALILNDLAAVYSMSGQSRRAVPLLEMDIEIMEKLGDKKNTAIPLGNVAQQQLVIGALAQAERNLRRSIELCREIEDEFWEAVGHQELGRLLAYRGAWQEAEENLLTAQKVFDEVGPSQTNYGSVNWSYRALRRLLMARETVNSNQSPVTRDQRSSVAGQPSPVSAQPSAVECARRALELADETARTQYPVERDYVRAHWLLGAAYRLEGVATGATGALGEAETHLGEALRRCRAINAVDGEADILLELAKLRQAQGQGAEARRLAAEALLITERSGYALQGADVHLFLAGLALTPTPLPPGEERFPAGEGREAALAHARAARRLATGWEMVDGKQVYDESGEYLYKAAYEEAGEILRRMKVEG